ncbi:MAG: sigma-70 family RNA polymerase sigma factor [Clostridia bacterium]|nr:sigma-70 family RNA polymerase sigma factor [Clostridia bacterium]
MMQLLYRDQNDETLVMLTLAGEQSAYEVLVTRYERTVILSALSVTHNRFMADDAAQDAFVTAWMKLNVLREPEKFGAWVCRIAKNCAANMITRYRSYLSLDELENCVAENEHETNPQVLYSASEDKEMLHKSISRLPQKVKEIICLHYFDGLSIAEIADRLRIAEGTVKWQLNNGRKKLRKELCSMNEEWNDTLVRRVMKKVEELKKWQFKNSKNGFETAYKDVLQDVEDLPESADKYHALADVLMRGWWWLPGDKNDALFSRIREAAELGKNDEVMRFIASREDSKVYGGSKIDFILEKQIPRLEEKGFVKALGSELFWLGHAYFQNKEPEKGADAYNRALTILPQNDIYHAYATAALAQEQKHVDEYITQKKGERNYRLSAAAEEYRVENGRLCRYRNEWFTCGTLCSADLEIDFVFRNASYCDGCFTREGMMPGDAFIGTDGTVLTFVLDSVAVDTPAGHFEGCQLWSVKHNESTYKNYYCRGVGIVKQERYYDGIFEQRLLGAYHIAGGEGLIPFAVGNSWEYVADYPAEVMRQYSKITVSYADEERVLLSQTHGLERLKYDENSWLDMIQQIRNDYWDGSKCCDVYYPIERAELLAKTPLEKAHTQAACAVARRILESDPQFSPDYRESGHWNFFARGNILIKEGRVCIDHNFRWSFELKNTDGSYSQETLLYNDVYGILQSAVNCIWCDEWETGKSFTEEFILWNDYPIKTRIDCEDAGEITTAAGTFQNCLKLSLDISGLTDGLAYRGGKKEYYFAEGVGIVRTVNNYCHNTIKAVYELTSYEGMGEGYMPLCDGMMRHYDAVNTTDGYIGSAEYTYVKNEDGDIVIFENRRGTQKKPEKITQYSAIYGEVMEDDLWKQKKHEESRLRHDINNFHLLCHFLGRPSRYWAAPKKAVAWNKYRMNILESLDEGQGVPRAWLGHYSSTCFRTACALFGCGENEEGYRYLDRSFELFPKWDEIKDGELLEVGDELIYGGIKLIKGKSAIELPDGSKEPLSYSWLFEENIGMMYYGLTAPRGWEWFNGVRNEERYKAAIERAKKLAENK